MKIKRQHLVQCLSNMLSHYDKETCTHEETKRGGAIWTICCQCDRHWSDDRNPFTPYVEPAFVTQARTLIHQYEES